MRNPFPTKRQTTPVIKAVPILMQFRMKTLFCRSMIVDVVDEISFLPNVAVKIPNVTVKMEDPKSKRPGRKSDPLMIFFPVSKMKNEKKRRLSM